ncbi:hypothetical protein [Enterococcus hirae]|uniref:hypothetical protein n=1 Tax=Enterococcus hirae TaxID=1354 RepID=UPI001376A0B9|nr:hypothetical protein [Enterococcus hirae]NBA56953.1 hypothetical protein [Enterococcus hirae]
MSILTGSKNFFTKTRRYIDSKFEDAKKYTDKAKADLSSVVSQYYAKKVDVYTKQETDEKLELKADTSSLAAVATTGNYNDLSQKPDLELFITRKELKGKLNVISTGEFFVVADNQNQAKKILFWNYERYPFKKEPKSCELYQQTYNLDANKWKINILMRAEYESSEISGRGIVYIFNVEEGINASEIDYCELNIDSWIAEDSYSSLSGIPKIIQSN